ncbi:MAG: DNA-directed RNA polymerase subunit omega [Proteobacteria bacterium]|jgi:DNA-directed RNA polymerase subunit omega|nr:DNA-directed RNA polymerase subunit omega [Pseudomonadota bacterium]
MINKNTVVDECLKRIPHRFDLVILASQRARMLYLGAATPLANPSSSKIDVALQEVAHGISTRDSIIKSFKTAVEVFEEDDEIMSEMQVKDIKDGVSYDDFDIDDSFEQE